MRTITESLGHAFGSRRASTLTLAAIALLITGEHCGQRAEVELIVQYGGAGPTADFARKVAVDGAGNAYVVGVIGNLPDQATAGELDAFLRKTDADGFELWTTVFGTTAADDAFNVAVADSGAVDASGDPIWDIYVIGHTSGVFPGETAVGSQDYFAAKFVEGEVDGETRGVAVWIEQFGTGQADNLGQSGAIALDTTSADPADRGLYVGGVSSAGPDHLTICVTGGVLGLCPSGSGDASVFRLDLDDGHVDPAYPLSFGSTASDFANAIVVVPSDDPAVAPTLYVAGQAGSGLRGVRRPGGVVEPITAAGSGGADGFLIAFDADTNVLTTAAGAPRVVQFGTSGVDTVNAMIADSAGDLILTGRRDLNAFVATYAGGFAPGAAALWQDTFGPGATVAIGFSVALDASERIYVSGAANGIIPGALIDPAETLLANNAFVRRYDGAVLTREFGTEVGDQGLGIAVNGDVVHVCGNTQGALVGGPGSSGNQDGYLRTYDLDLASVPATSYVVTDQFGGTGPVFDEILGIEADRWGDVVSVGSTAGALPGQVSAGLADLVVEKRDAEGQILWTRQLGTTAPDLGFDVAIDRDGAIYVAGGTAGILPDLVPGSAPGGGADAALWKFDADGNLLWTRQWGTTGIDGAAAIALDAQGRIYVTGARNNDAYVSRLASDGSLVWEVPIATTANDAGTAVATDGSSIWVAGTVGALVPGALTDPDEVLGNLDGFLALYDASGAQALVVTFGTAGSDGVTGVAADPSGAYVTGVTPQALPGHDGAIYLRAYDEAGVERWTRTFASFGAGNTAEGLVAGIGQVYMTGGILGPLPDQQAFGFVDVYARKYLADGTEVWTVQFGTAAADGARDVALAGPDDVLLAGTTPGALPGQTSFGAGDAWQARLEQFIFQIE